MHWIDPDHLPQTVGTVVQLLQNPKGHLDGLVLDRDRQVHFPPHLGRKVAKIIAVGDKVHVRGVRPRGASVIAAVSLGKSHGTEIVDNGPDAERRDPKAAKGEHSRAQIAGTVRIALHGPKGELWGGLLDDGTVVRVGPKEVAGQARRLKAGARFSARCSVLENQYGRVAEIDPSAGSTAGHRAAKKAAGKKKR